MITVTHLSKHFQIALPGESLAGKLKRLVAPRVKTIRAVDDVSFEIRAGEIVGYLGPNGAGKSTTIKLLTGVLYPTAGEARVNGMVPHKDRTRNAYQIGIVFGQRSQLWWDLPLVDSFEILAAMYRIPRPRWRASVAFLADLLEMGDFLAQPVRKLSLGQRMKGDLVAALLHEPPILYLDEPTIGLDVVSKKRVLQFLKDLNAQKGTTILLTTHNLSDVELLCPRILILNHGQIVLDATQGEIMAQFGRERVLVAEFDSPGLELSAPKGRVIRVEENKAWISFDRAEISAFDLARGMNQAERIKDISIEEPDIESIIGRLYEQGFYKERNDAE